jgi:hypothetical protein
MPKTGLDLFLWFMSIQFFVSTIFMIVRILNGMSFENAFGHFSLAMLLGVFISAFVTYIVSKLS